MMKPSERGVRRAQRNLSRYLAPGEQVLEVDRAWVTALVDTADVGASQRAVYLLLIGPRGPAGMFVFPFDELAAKWDEEDHFLELNRLTPTGEPAGGITLNFADQAAKGATICRYIADMAL